MVIFTELGIIDVGDCTTGCAPKVVVVFVFAGEVKLKVPAALPLCSAGFASPNVGWTDFVGESNAFGPELKILDVEVCFVEKILELESLLTSVDAGSCVGRSKMLV